jgi:hypothetical protein
MEREEGSSLARLPVPGLFGRRRRQTGTVAVLLAADSQGFCFRLFLVLLGVAHLHCDCNHRGLEQRRLCATWVHFDVTNVYARIIIARTRAKSQACPVHRG